jgi:hypothetical protein
MCVYMHFRFVENHLIRILEDEPLISEVVLSQLRDGPLLNRSRNKKSVNSGQMSNMSKSLIIIMTLHLLKTKSNETSLIALKRTIRASLNLINLITSDRMNMWGTGHKISRVSSLKSSNLLSNRMLPFQMKNSITRRSWLRKSSDCESRRRVTVRWPTMKADEGSSEEESVRGGLNRRRR